MEPQYYTITAALPYANGPLHVGHLAGAYLPADIYARYLRLRGENVIFICGSDEHGVAITLQALKNKVTPEEIVAKYHKMIGDSLQKIGISCDIYHRTSSQMHKSIAEKFFLTLLQKNTFEVHEQQQYYDPEYKQFLADRYIVGECPECHYDNAYGDQCEKCGSSLTPLELLNPKSALSQAPLVLKNTKHWYLPLGDFQEELLAYLSSKKAVFRKNVLGQCLGWIEQGLKKRAVTRDLTWGIPVPVEGAKGKVLYVWFEAPIGYISATHELFEARNNTNYPLERKAEYYINEQPSTTALNPRAHWEGSSAKVVNFIGKDNIVFHSIIFPSMLLAHGDYTLPHNVVANEFLNLEGKKISTSRNWAVWLHTYLEEFPNQQDSLRYYLCTNAPEAKDSDFSWESFQASNNNELVAIVGNFINRVFTLIHKYYNAQVPEVRHMQLQDDQFLEVLSVLSWDVTQFLDEYKFRDSLQSLVDIARLGNKYLTEHEPWKMVKTDPGRVETVLALALQAILRLAIHAGPFLPFSSRKLLVALNLRSVVTWDELLKAKFINLAGNVLGNLGLLFDKISDEAVVKQLEKLGVGLRSSTDRI